MERNFLVKSEILKTYEHWILELSKRIDDPLCSELFKEIQGEQEECIEDRYYKDLEFGTGGLRGILGAGTNRMNIFTVAKATAGFGDYINKKTKRPSVAISMDSRNKSELFAKIAAQIMSAKGIDVFLFSELAPTPTLSFAVRHFGCSGGIMVTASHNPAQYNGYKVYDERGCQIGLEEADEILGFIERTDSFEAYDSIKAGRGTGTIKIIENSLMETFLDTVFENGVGDKDIRNLNVVYSPLNGAGNKYVRRILEKLGLPKENLHIVKEQENPDGNFPTCPYPNPEKPAAMELGAKLFFELQKEGKADIFIATDPDSDRIAVMEGDRIFTGNEMGALIFDYICNSRKDKMPARPVAARTVVSAKMIDAVAMEFGVEIIVTLTGFKFIGEQIAMLEDQGREKDYIFGFEESIGYLPGTYVRDKDAVGAAMIICQMAAAYKRQGITLENRLVQLYEKYGWYESCLEEIVLEGAEGMEKMNTIMDLLRAEMPSAIGEKSVMEIIDYQKQEHRILKGTKSCSMLAGTKPTGLPKSNVLEIALEGMSGFCVRPSGTEPKLKIYFNSVGKTKKDAEEIIAQMSKAVADLIKTGGK